MAPLVRALLPRQPTPTLPCALQVVGIRECVILFKDKQCTCCRYAEVTFGISWHFVADLGCPAGIQITSYRLPRSSTTEKSNRTKLSTAYPCGGRVVARECAPALPVPLEQGWKDITQTAKTSMSASHLRKNYMYYVSVTIHQLKYVEPCVSEQNEVVLEWQTHSLSSKAKRYPLASSVMCLTDANKVFTIQHAVGARVCRAWKG